MKYRIIFASGLLLFASSATFATITGKQLLNNCLNKPNHPEQLQGTKKGRNFCMGYIAGFLDTYVLTTALYRVNNQERHFCLGDKGISYTDAIRVTITYLNNHPDLLNDSARKLLIMAFAKNYPCKGQYKDSLQTPPQKHDDDDTRYQN